MVGRGLLGLYFLVPGLTKLLVPELQLALMYQHSIAYASLLIYLAGFGQVLGALALLTNRHVRFACLGFVVYVVMINFSMHDFWNYTDGAAVRELQSFIKNLAILAGLLVLAGASVRRKFIFRTVLLSDRIRN